MKSSSKHAFSLVELSIVLVILGLLTGGILTGQNLIRAAELRAVSTEFNRYQTAMFTFRDKYFAVPGDMTNATNFWGSAGGTGQDATCYQTEGTGTETCNGNGDGQIKYSNPALNELARAWQHLTNAGLIEGSYTGVSDSTGCYHCITVGANVPQSKVSNAGWTMFHITAATDGPQWFKGDYGNAMFVGTEGNYTSNPFLSPEEAWSIDKKIDDGMPGMGFLRSWSNTFDPDCTTTNDHQTSEYELSITSIECALIFESGI